MSEEGRGRDGPSPSLPAERADTGIANVWPAALETINPRGFKTPGLCWLRQLRKQTEEPAYRSLVPSANVTSFIPGLPFGTRLTDPFPGPSSDQQLRQEAFPDSSSPHQAKNKTSV